MSGNLYHCAMERNQNGKYNIRIRVQFERGGLVLVASISSRRPSMPR